MFVMWVYRRQKSEQVDQSAIDWLYFFQLLLFDGHR